MSIALGVALLISGALALGADGYIAGAIFTTVGLFGLYKSKNTKSNVIACHQLDESVYERYLAI